MAATSLKRSLFTTPSPKYDSFLVGNAAYNPSSFESIATATPTGTSVTFSSIPSTYKHLQLRFNVIAPAGNPSLAITYNGVTTATYVTHTLVGNGATASASGSTGRTSLPLAWAQGMLPTYPNVSVMDVIDYASTTKNKVHRAIYGQENNSGTTVSTLELMSGVWLSTAAINSITITVTGGGPVFQSGTTISLYGIKG